jgi:cyclic pyranopterin phosphate synthase
VHLEDGGRITAPEHGLPRLGQSVAKGDVLQVACIAGIMGAKHTPALIPMCHPLEITNVEVDLWPDAEGLRVCIEACVRNMGRTGVEMEALTATSIACLTIYDMVKAIERGMRIEGIRLLHKSGGKSGEWRAET